MKDRRRKLRSIVDETVKNFEASDTARLLDSNFEAAFRMMTSTQARAAFDLAMAANGREPLLHVGQAAANPFGSCVPRIAVALKPATIIGNDHDQFIRLHGDLHADTGRGD